MDEPEKKEKRAFTNLDELWEILNPKNQKEIKESAKSMPNEVDRRRHSRSETSCFSEYFLNLSPGDDVSHGVIANMSRSGLCFYTPEMLNKGDDIFIKCDRNSPVQRATVRWCKQYKHYHYKSGLEFSTEKNT